MQVRRWAGAALGAALAAAAISGSALAQKSGGILRIYHMDNPPSASIHEEGTASVVVPFMAVFNNLVLYPWLRRRGWEPLSFEDAIRAEPGRLEGEGEVTLRIGRHTRPDRRRALPERPRQSSPASGPKRRPSLPSTPRGWPRCPCPRTHH